MTPAKCIQYGMWILGFYCFRRAQSIKTRRRRLSFVPSPARRRSALPETAFWLFLVVSSSSPHSLRHRLFRLERDSVSDVTPTGRPPFSRRGSASTASGDSPERKWCWHAQNQRFFFSFSLSFWPVCPSEEKDLFLFWRRSAIGSVTSIDRVFSFPSTSHPPLFRHPMTISIEFRTQLLLRRRRQLRGSQTGYFLSTLSFNAAQHRSSCVIIHHPRRRVTVLLRSLNISYHWLRPFPFLYTAGPLPVAELWE